MQRNIISAMLDDGTTQLVFERVLPGSEVVEEPETVELADRTEVQQGVRHTLTLRLLLDPSARDQVATWIRNRTPVKIVAETLTDVLIWQDRQLMLADAGSEGQAAVMRITTSEANLY